MSSQMVVDDKSISDDNSSAVCITKNFSSNMTLRFTKRRIEIGVTTSKLQ
ncbi:MAG: hypothetical protein WAM14_20185 [Candidatus Nitrosopolaris sp.]